MINFPIFVEGLLMPLLGQGVFVVYKEIEEKEKKVSCTTNPSTT